MHEKIGNNCNQDTNNKEWDNGLTNKDSDKLLSIFFDYINF